MNNKTPGQTVTFPLGELLFLKKNGKQQACWWRCGEIGTCALLVGVESGAAAPRDRGMIHDSQKVEAALARLAERLER